MKLYGNFNNSYSELVNEFYENSYYNETFAAFLMLPLRSLEDLNLKDCFWHHEHLGFVRLSSEKVKILSWGKIFVFHILSQIKT